MDLKERLTKARKQAGLTQKALSEKSGVSQQMISKLERGDSKETADIVALASACDVRPEWLASENGPIYPEPPETPTPSADGKYVVFGHGIHTEIDQEALDIAISWRALSPETKRLIQRQIFEEVGDLAPVLQRILDNLSTENQERSNKILNEAQKKERAQKEDKKEEEK